jgi:hypothetical protein
MLNKKLVKIAEKLRSTKSEMLNSLKENFPEGSKVRFNIKHGQKNPSSGTVIYWDGDGYLRVRLDNAKPYRAVRDVHFSSII